MHPTPPTPDKKTFRLAEQLSNIGICKDIEVFGPKVVAIMEAVGDRLRH